MSTKIHDEMIKEAVRWAKSLGYGVVDYNLGTETGADAVFENRFGEKVILVLESDPKNKLAGVKLLRNEKLMFGCR